MRKLKQAEKKKKQLLLTSTDGQPERKCWSFREKYKEDSSSQGKNPSKSAEKVLESSGFGRS